VVVQVIWEDGSMYEGELHNLQPNGTGRKDCSDGTLYYGHWWDGLRDGHGRLTYANNDVLECEFNYDKPCGQVGAVAPLYRTQHGRGAALDHGIGLTTLACPQGTLTWATGRSLSGVFTETGLPQDCTMTATAIWCAEG
jgi:hypothetical protein